MGKNILLGGALAASAAAAFWFAILPGTAQNTVAIDNDDIGGTVTERQRSRRRVSG